MAKCKNCKANVPEGIEYCEDCQDKMNLKKNESYLDSLLNSVKNSPTMDMIYKKKNNVDEKGSPETTIASDQKKIDEPGAYMGRGKDPYDLSDMEEDDLYRVDFSDIEDFKDFNFAEDLEDIDSDIIIKDEDLYGSSLSDLLETEQDELSDEAEIEKTIQREYSEEPFLEEPQNRLDQKEVAISIMEADDTEQSDHNIQFQPVMDIQNSDSNFDENDLRVQIMSEPGLQEQVDPDQSMDNMDQEEYSELSADTDIDLDLDDLLNSLDTQHLEETVTKNMENPDEDIFSTFGNENLEELLLGGMGSEEDNKSEFEQVEADHDDFLSLLGQISEEDPAAEDIRAISDMLSGGPISSMETNRPSDVGAVFSDALKAVSSLNDYEQEEEEILQKASGKTIKKGKPGKGAKEEKITEKAKKAKKGKDKPKKEKSGLSLFKRLFGNIKDDKTAAMHEEELRKQSEPKAVKVKKAKGKNKKGTEPFDEDDENQVGKTDAKEKAVKKASKKEKAEKKKKTKEVIQVIDEIDEDPGRINRLGALIVFFFFGVIAVILIIGSNLVTYSLSIQHATNYFNHRKYTQAYNEVYGVDIRDEDIEMYDKIQTVMFVNKQLNSYNNFYAIEKYPEALDSLLKGLSRYDKYIELATMLGIESDLDYVRSQILAELNNVFHLSEAEAMQILKYDNMVDYSLAVYDVVLEKMNN